MVLGGKRYTDYPYYVLYWRILYKYISNILPEFALFDNRKSVKKSNISDLVYAGWHTEHRSLGRPWKGLDPPHHRLQTTSNRMFKTVGGGGVLTTYGIQSVQCICHNVFVRHGLFKQLNDIYVVHAGMKVANIAMVANNIESLTFCLEMKCSRTYIFKACQHSTAYRKLFNYSPIELFYINCIVVNCLNCISRTFLSLSNLA